MLAILVTFFLGLALVKCDDVWVPECFRYRLDYEIQSTNSGPIDIRIDIDTASLAGKISDCSEFRFRQQDTEEWLEYWWESPSTCQTSAISHVWVTPEFRGGNVIVEVYYGCRLADGSSASPPSTYGDPVSWSGSFYMMTNQDCGSGWTDDTDNWKNEDKLFLRAYLTTSTTFMAKFRGQFRVHGHSSDETTIVDSCTAYRNQPQTGTGHPTNEGDHVHSLSTITVGDPSNGRPPCINMEMCVGSGTNLDIRQNHIVLQTGSYTLGSVGWTRYSAADDKLIRIKYCEANGVCGTGGNPNHQHLLSGSVGPGQSQTDFQSGGGYSCSKPGHTHTITNRWSSWSSADPVSNMPDRQPVVLARRTSGSAVAVTDDMMFIASEKPPKGFREVTGMDGLYLMGAADTGAMIPKATHYHERWVLTSVNDDSYGGSTSGSNVPDDDHGHDWAFWKSTNGADADQNNNRQIHIFLWTYNMTYAQEGIFVHPEHAFDCDGIYWADPAVCNQYGECYAQNTTCVCQEDKATGQFCHIPVCFGYAADSGYECNDQNGTCTMDWPQPYCDCFEHHSGANCVIDAVCDGHPWHDFFTCTNRTRGDCQNIDGTTGNDHCVCSTGYDGDNCEYQLCDDISSEHDYVCSGHGIGIHHGCPHPDSCRCHNQWVGKWCQNKVTCGGYEFDNPLRCRMRGVCTTEGCACEDSYEGNDCEVAPCFGEPSSSPYVCSSTPAQVRGVCWEVDECMCFTSLGFYGRECDEWLPSGTVFMEGWTTDPYYEFSVPYVASLDMIPGIELPIGSPFDCTVRLLKPGMDAHVGLNASCVWTADPEANYTTSVDFTLPREAPIVVQKRHADLRFNLLTSISPLFFAEVRVKYKIKKPVVGDDDDDVRTFDPAIFAAVLVPILLLLFALVVVAVVVAIFTVMGFRRSKARQTDLSAKMVELQRVQEMFAHDKEKLELAIRLQKMKAQGKEPLPDEFQQLAAFDDDNQCVLMDPVPGDKVWRHSQCRAAVWRGHMLVMRRLPLSLITKREVNMLVGRATQWATAPPHPNVRRYHAYMVEGMDLGAIKKAASGPKLLQTFADEFDSTMTDAAMLAAPDHGFIMEPVRRVDPELLDYMWASRREAAAALSNVTVVSGTKEEDKIHWLSQAAQAIRHLHWNGFVFGNLNVHCLLLDSDENVKVDLPHLTREPARNAFVAPETVLESLGRVVESVELEDGEEPLSEHEKATRADVYSFGMVMYCILTETKRPFRKKRDDVPEETGVGEHAASNADFRPSLDHPLLKSWSLNLLRLCFEEKPENRMSMENLAAQLELIDHLEQVCEEEDFQAESSEGFGFSSDCEDESKPLLGVGSQQLSYEEQ